MDGRGWARQKPGVGNAVCSSWVTGTVKPVPGPPRGHTSRKLDGKQHWAGTEVSDVGCGILSGVLTYAPGAPCPASPCMKARGQEAFFLPCFLAALIAEL